MLFSRQRFVLAAAMILGTGALHACGPFFPETILDQDRATLRPPITNFENEVRQLLPPSSPPAVALPLAPISASNQGMYREVQEEILNPEEKELADILAALPSDQRQKIVENYSAMRAAMLNKYQPFDDYDTHVPAEGYNLFAQAQLGHWPDGLPADIVLYLEGALRYDYGDKPGAIALWQKLLALPHDERLNRSVAAAWMIAKATRETDGLAAAQPWYLLCEKLSTEGFRDCLRLGLASLGWQARYALDQGDRRKALELYYHQAMAGDPFGWSSLRRSLPDIDKLSDEQLAAVAKDPFQRGLFTAEFLADAFSWGSDFTTSAAINTPINRWLGAIERANVFELNEAAQFAELAYSAGGFDLAKRWLQRAPAANPQALWIKGKLALMEGHVKAAQDYLTQAQAGFPREAGSADCSIRFDGRASLTALEAKDYRTSQFYGDLGATNLGCNNYFPALTALYKGSFFDDAAYVAERVLSAEELLDYTRKHFPTPTGPLKEIYYHVAGSANYQNRYLLARRLAREHYFKDARAFYPDELRPVFDRYVSLLAQSRKAATKAERAQALWEAAQIHRSLGMPLFGTEGEPDSFADGGSFPGYPMAENRLGITLGKFPYAERPGTVEALPRATADERARVQKNKLPCEERYQYRYLAADMAWKAARLMPNNSEDTARVLGIAGSWLKAEDPKAADRFYKAMIWRNWSTPLAREADQRRWFPSIPWDYDPFAAAGVSRPEGL